jgi:hypothetical protein
VTIASVIITIIVYVFTSVLINVGLIVIPELLKVIKLGFIPVARSLTTDTLVT